MKEHNELVGFKNSFLGKSMKKEALTKILTEDFQEAVTEKINSLVELYRRTISEQGYSIPLAYRVIILCVLSSFQVNFNPVEQIHRFFNHCLKIGELEQIAVCFDLLLLKEIREVIKEQNERILKIRVLRSLANFYARSGNKKDRKKSRETLREYCKQTLTRQSIKRNPALYQQVLDTLIEAVKNRISKLVGRGDKIKAIEQLTAFIGILEKNEQVVSKKYQLQLMRAYWTLAQLHDQLHYWAYTKKYAFIAMNIAQRIEEREAVRELKLMLEALA